MTAPVPEPPCQEDAATFALLTRARADHEAGRWAQAVEGYRQVLQRGPARAEVWYALGRACQEGKRHAEAVAAYQESLRLEPHVALTHNSLGVALVSQGLREEAAHCFRRALQLQPGLASAHSNLGNVAREQGHRDEAMACYREAVRLAPCSAHAHNNLALLLVQQGRLEEALDHYGEALRLRPDFPEARRNRALAWLAQGELVRGWAEYEWRWRCPEAQPPPLDRPLWDGSPLAGRTILLHAEQGLGDTLQFVRYARPVRQRGGKVLLFCQKPLARLLATCAGVDRVLTEGERLPPFDVHAPLLSLPGLLGSTLANLPCEVPYLTPDPALVAQWQRRREPGQRLTVGIAWQGNPRHPQDRWRSVALERFAPLASLPGLRLVSLQKGAGQEQLGSVRFPVEDLGSHFEDFQDTAAALSTLDLVIAVDTALVHLAGALGLPVWVALPFAPDWRWLLGRCSSPWYPSVRLFRQPQPDDWDEVFQRLAAALEQHIARLARRES